MDDRQKIIVNEIRKWQKNKLLPSMYCQFLLSLYTSGEDENKENLSHSMTMKSQFKKVILSFIAMILFILAILFVIYFTQFSPAFQLIVLMLFLVLSIISSTHFARRNPVFSHLYVILASFMSFIITIIGVDIIFTDERLPLGIAIVILCSIWIVIGWHFRYHYLYIAGGTGILLFISLILLERL